jgi:hypothetical protein
MNATVTHVCFICCGVSTTQICLTCYRDAPSTCEPFPPFLFTNPFTYTRAPFKYRASGAVRRPARRKTKGY